MPPPPKPSRPESISNALNARAFSLLELLTVIAILGILASVAMPGLQSILKGNALRTASEQAWSAVSTARQQAIARQSNVAVVITSGRSTENSEKVDAIMLLLAKHTDQGWSWTPISRWNKLPRGVETKPEADSYLSSTNPHPTVAAYERLSSDLPKIDGESVTSFTFVVFRPDGSVDSATANPVLGFRRLKSTATAAESALVLSPDSGRARFVEL
jgi:prepilin-type N-terminal cleavage/methylation domain-containing protein